MIFLFYLLGKSCILPLVQNFGKIDMDIEVCVQGSHLSFFFLIFFPVFFLLGSLLMWRGSIPFAPIDQCMYHYRFRLMGQQLFLWPKAFWRICEYKIYGVYTNQCSKSNHQLSLLGAPTELFQFVIIFSLCKILTAHSFLLCIIEQALDASKSSV